MPSADYDAESIYADVSRPLEAVTGVQPLPTGVGWRARPENSFPRRVSGDGSPLSGSCLTQWRERYDERRLILPDVLFRKSKEPGRRVGKKSAMVVKSRRKILVTYSLDQLTLQSHVFSSPFQPLKRRVWLPLPQVRRCTLPCEYASRKRGAQPPLHQFTHLCSGTEVQVELGMSSANTEVDLQNELPFSDELPSCRGRELSRLQNLLSLYI